MSAAGNSRRGCEPRGYPLHLSPPRGPHRPDRCCPSAAERRSRGCEQRRVSAAAVTAPMRLPKAPLAPTSSPPLHIHVRFLLNCFVAFWILSFDLHLVTFGFSLSLCQMFVGGSEVLAMAHIAMPPHRLPLLYFAHYGECILPSCYRSDYINYKGNSHHGAQDT